MSPVAIVARAATQSELPVSLWCELNGFRFANVANLRHEHFFPGAVKYGDIDAILASRNGGFIGLSGESGEELWLTNRAAAAGAFDLQVE